MKKFDDEILMAYVDSELGPEDSKEVELFLAADQGARETVERYRKTRAAIDQFAAVLDEPVPDHLIDTIARHDRQATVVKLPPRPQTSHRWMAIAASLVIGVGLGTLTMNYLAVQSSRNEAATAANKMAELSKTLEAMKAEKNLSQQAVSLAKSTIDEMTSALEIAQAETGKAREQVLAANRENPKDPLVEEVENIFPVKLVAEAIDNGATLPADIRESLLAELNTEEPPVTKASSFSKLIRKSSEGGLTTNASQYESLSDLQPTETDKTNIVESLEPKKVNTILGEFSYSGKTCRLFEYEHLPKAKVSTLIACRNISGLWQIIRSR